MSGKVFFLNGSFVSNGLPGKNIMERIDNVYAQEQAQQAQKPQQSTAATHSVNIIDVPAPVRSIETRETIATASICEVTDDNMTDEDLEVKQLEIMWGDAWKKASVVKKVKFDGVEIPSRNSQQKCDVAPPTAKLPSHSSLSL